MQSQTANGQHGAYCRIYSILARCRQQQIRPSQEHRHNTHYIDRKSPASQIEGLTYERLSSTDDENSDIGDVATKASAASAIIDVAAASSGRVLAHYSAAISRLPTTVAAYL
ncbi:hypothetical protein B0T26DRAFT_709482 [Lasiosphaeria miniovina]|uniref:Uncharacterized protein n=1 Tax=Lasiosphaeria miniovina TaxID=1954250 RepID=A0AA40DZM2_9PEZI|nr:uncharacterized protein B0T26DRAFT_709482 [Lasiosphaeria miniovina]KAK0717303.1 hypothetical protein B0T26DRAFT_709482 [Lasiosphaeria miniovina]